MSLVGFKSQNHPQQVDKRGAKEATDDRAITPEDFGPLHERFRFTIDACATPANARLWRFWTKEDDALAQSWKGERVWCNPPYSNIGEWVKKAWKEYAVGTDSIVMLLPANRTEQRWWQDDVEPYRDDRWGLKVEFLPGRMRFIQAGRTAVGPNERPPFGCCLLIWGALPTHPLARRWMYKTYGEATA
jgi:phage N-6-adenine-methyltransferase